MACLKFVLGSSVRHLEAEVSSATQLLGQVQCDVHGVGEWESMLSTVPEAGNIAMVLNKSPPRKSRGQMLQIRGVICKRAASHTGSSVQIAPGEVAAEAHLLNS